jgi:hypothetical protein
MSCSIASEELCFDLLNDPLVVVQGSELTHDTLKGGNVRYKHTHQGAGFIVWVVGGCDWVQELLVQQI